MYEQIWLHFPKWTGKYHCSKNCFCSTLLIRGRKSLIWIKIIRLYIECNPGHLDNVPFTKCLLWSVSKLNLGREPLVCCFVSHESVNYFLTSWYHEGQLVHFWSIVDKCLLGNSGRNPFLSKYEYFISWTTYPWSSRSSKFLQFPPTSLECNAD